MGIRPGEKLHEIMIPIDEAHRTIEFDNFYIIQPEFHFWGENNKWTDGETVPTDFEYNSINNPIFLSAEDMNRIVNLI